MKMYYFNPNDYDQQYYVMAKNKTNAYKALMSYLTNKIETDYHKDHYKREMQIWEKVNPLDSSTFPYKYTLDECEEEIVIESEIC